MKVFDFEQRSPEWYAARVGIFTASRAADMLAVIKSGEAAARRNLRMQLVLERLTGISQDDGGFVSADMQRGCDKEPIAVAEYESRTGHLVRPVGFVQHDTLPVGCSPDGIVGEFAGGLELKCPKSATHLGYLRAGVVPPEYLGQIVHSLWLTGAKWWDFVSFDDRFVPELQFFRVRVERNETDIKAYELKTVQFLREVDEELGSVVAMAAKAREHAA